jgi:hypothetical protein
MTTVQERLVGSVPANRMSAVRMSYRNGPDTAPEIRLQEWHYQPSHGGSTDYATQLLAAAQTMLPQDIFQRVSKAAWAAEDTQKAHDLAAKFNGRRHR